jgi:acyl carrier protein
MPIDWNDFARAYPAFAADAFLQSQVVGPRSGTTVDAAGALTSTGLRALDSGPRTEALQEYLRAEAARVLGFTPERLDCAEPLASFGFDSLMAVQLKNRIEADLGIVVPMIQFLQGPSVDQLVLALQEMVAGAARTAGTNTEEGVETWDVGSL